MLTAQLSSAQPGLFISLEMQQLDYQSTELLIVKSTNNTVQTELSKLITVADCCLDCPTVVVENCEGLIQNTSAAVHKINCSKCFPK